MSDDVEYLNTYEKVEVKFVKERPTKNGGAVYNICLNDGGEDFWLSAGFTNPGCQKGDRISLSTYENNNGYEQIDVDTIEIIPKQRKTTQRNTSSKDKVTVKKGTVNKTGGSFSSEDKEEYWSWKLKNDAERWKHYFEVSLPQNQWRDARVAAVSFVDLLFKHDAIELTVTSPKTGKPIKAKVNQLTEALEALVENYTKVFYQDTRKINSGVSFDVADVEEPEEENEVEGGEEDYD